MGDALPAQPRPVKLVQFGDGVFLRGFIDWMVQRMNDLAGFNGGVCVIKAVAGSFDPAWSLQDRCFTVSRLGIERGKIAQLRERISVVERLVNPHDDFGAFLREADNADLVCVVSNVPESSFIYSENDRSAGKPAEAYPGKLTQFLRRRFESFSGDADKGLLILPCELIEANATILRSLVLAYAARWYDDPDFEAWITLYCRFLDTLVDCIVIGAEESDKADWHSESGLRDELMVNCEFNHQLTIMGNSGLERILPFAAAGLNVVWVDDLGLARLLKTRILNTSHIFLTLCGIPMGLGNVLDCMDHPVLRPAMDQLLAEEIIPFLEIDEDTLDFYHDSVRWRLSNPVINHRLSTLAQFAINKWKTRSLPALLEMVERSGSLPKMLCFSLAALIFRYTSGEAVQDEPRSVAFFSSLSRLVQNDTLNAMWSIVHDRSLWGESLSTLRGLEEMVGQQLSQILQLGMSEALRQLLNENPIS